MISLKERVKSFISDDEVRQYSDLRGIGYLFRLSKRNYYQLVIAVAILVLSVACIMCSAHLLGLLFQELADDKQFVWQYVIAFLVFEVLAAVLRCYGSLYLVYVTNNVILSTRKLLFQKLSRLSVSYFDRQPLGRTLSRITTDVEGVESFFLNVMPSSLACCIEIILILISMLIVDLQFGFIIVCTTIPAFVFTVVMRAPVKFWMRIQKKVNALVLSRFAELVNGFEVIKSFNLERWSFGKYKDVNMMNYRVHLKIMNWNAFIRPMIILLCKMPILLVVIIGGMMVIDNSLTIAIFVSFLRFSEKLLLPVNILSHDIQIIQDALTSAERVRQMLDEIEEGYQDGDIDKKIHGDIEFIAVHLDYLRDKDVLKGISFHAKQGMKIGLVGETGAGKTSTVNIIPALYSFSRGEVLIDGIPLRQWSKPWLRKHIGYINQDVVIFQGTLRDNIVCAQEDVDDETIYQLADRLGFAERLINFPQGLNSAILEHGQNLSAGERQIVAFMRMMIKNPQILILDEATANVDYDYEQLLHRALFDLMADKTCFIIAHRLATVQQCEVILVFKDGRIVERGNHQSLYADHNSYYRHMQSALMV